MATNVRVKLNDREKEQLKHNDSSYLTTLMRRFKKQVEKNDILYEVKKREFYMNKTLKRKEKDKRAKIRNLKNKKNF